MSGSKLYALYKFDVLNQQVILIVKLYVGIMCFVWLLYVYSAVQTYQFIIIYTKHTMVLT